MPTQPAFFIHFDPPEHTRYRKPLTGQFTVRRMRQLEEWIQQITDERVEAMAQAGPPVDLVQVFAMPIPSLVICELLGVPYDDRERFQADSQTILYLTVEKERIYQALANISGYLHQLVLAKRAEPGDDLVSGLVQGGELTDEEVMNIAHLLLVAGYETTANMLSHGTYALLRHLEQVAALSADQSLIDGAVEEVGELWRTAMAVRVVADDGQAGFGWVATGCGEDAGGVDSLLRSSARWTFHRSMMRGISACMNSKKVTVSRRRAPAGVVSPTAVIPSRRKPTKRKRIWSRRKMASCQTSS